MLLAAALVLAPAASALELTATPATISFGDPVLVTATGAEPLELELGPWTALGPPETSPAAGGVTVTQHVTCLVEACLPTNGTRSVALPVARAAGRATAARILVEPRVAAAAVAAAKAAYRRSTEPPPVTGHRGSTAGLLAAALALLLGAALVAVPWRRERPAAAGPPDDALARALRLLRESARRPAPDRRRAADLAGRVAPAVAARAGSVAWSRPDPDAAEVDELAGRLEKLG